MEKISSVSFGKLYTGVFVKEGIKQNPDLKKELHQVQRLVRSNGLHKTKHVDVILQYNDWRGFYGIISSKKQGTPMNPQATSGSITKNTINDFSEWVHGWDEAYSPKVLKEWKKLKNLWKLMKK